MTHYFSRYFFLSRMQILPFGASASLIPVREYQCCCIGVLLSFCPYLPSVPITSETDVSVSRGTAKAAASAVDAPNEELDLL